MDSRRRFIGRVATGLAGTLAAVPVRALGAGRIRFGIIGVGDRGTELIQQIRACSNTEIAGVADVFTARLARAHAASAGVTGYSDYRRLLEDPSIDAVAIATPQHLRAEQFCDALEAGKHVYVEKTLALTLSQTKRMRAAYVRDAGKHVVQVGH